ncbi:MAG: hypothetical protein ACFCVD_02105 [Nodosilinea sp.]
MTTPPDEGGQLCSACGGTRHVPNDAWTLFQRWAQETFEVDVTTCPADQAEAIARRFESTFGPREELCPTCQPYPQNTHGHP